MKFGAASILLNPLQCISNHIPPLLCWVTPKGSTLNQLNCNILLCLKCINKFHGTMDFFLWNLIWETLGNISILKGTPGFHCTYTLYLLLLNCKCFDLKEHSQGKSCLHENDWVQFHLAEKTGSCWAKQSHLCQPLEDGHRENGPEWCWLFLQDCLWDCCVMGRTKQEPGCRFLQAESQRELLPTSLHPKEHQCWPLHSHPSVSVNGAFWKHVGLSERIGVQHKLGDTFTAPKLIRNSFFSFLLKEEKDCSIWLLGSPGNFWQPLLPQCFVTLTISGANAINFAVTRAEGRW